MSEWRRRWGRISVKNEFLRILCFKAGIHTRSEFVASTHEAYARHSRVDRGEEPHRRSNLTSTALERGAENAGKYHQRWLLESKGWTHDTIRPVVNVLNERLGIPTAKLDSILTGGMPVQDVLALLNLSINDVRDVVSEKTLAAHNNQHGRLSFFDRLVAQYRSDPEAIAVLNNAPGVYHLYRRHSTRLGLLREVVVIEAVNDMQCTGTYYHYVADKGRPAPDTDCTIVPSARVTFHTYYCGYYTLSLGLYIDAGRCELVSVRVYNAALTIDRKGQKERYHAGILSSVYDLNETLMAERVLMRKVSDTPTTAAADVYHLQGGDEFERYRGFLDNSDPNGRVFSCPFDRLHKILAHD